MKKSTTRFLGLTLVGSFFALASLNKAPIVTLAAEGDTDSDYSYNLSFYDDFNGQLKNGWSYAKGGSSYTYVEGEQTKYGWLFNGQDHIQYKRANSPSDSGKLLYGDSSSKNYVFEVKVKADTNMTAQEYIDANSSSLPANRTIDSYIPFFVQNQSPENAGADRFYGRSIAFSNYAIGFYEFGESGSGWAKNNGKDSVIRLTKFAPDFTWNDWHTIRVLANDSVCKLFVDGSQVLEAAQSEFTKSTGTNGACGIGASVLDGYDSIHYDDFKYYEANPNYYKKVPSTSTLDLLSKDKITSSNAKMNFTANGNKVGFSIPSTNGEYGTQITTFNQEYNSLDMDVAVDLENQEALAVKANGKNIRVSGESGFIFGAESADKTAITYNLIGFNINKTNNNGGSVNTFSLVSQPWVKGKKGTPTPLFSSTVSSITPYVRFSLKNKKLSVTVFKDKASYDSETPISSPKEFDLSSNWGGNHFGLRCNCGTTQALIYETEILNFSTSDGGTEYPSTDVKIAPEANNGPYTVTIPTLTNGKIMDGETELNSNISMDEHTSKTLKIIPNEGYAISKVTLNGKNIGPAKEIKLENITRNTEIGVEFVATSSIDVYLLAGQSNAAGQTPINGLFKEYTGLTQDKIDEYKDGYDNVFYYGTTGTNDPTKGNMGMSIVRAGEGNDSSSMGPELGFGEYVSPLLASANKQAAVIKYAVGATGFANSDSATAQKFGNWLSPTSRTEEGDACIDNAGLLYDNLLKTTKSGLQDLIDRGYRPVIKGIMWMQGCADAGSLTLANKYAHHLTNLINDLRSDLTSLETELTLDKGNHEFVAGKINDNLQNATYEEVIREQIQLVSETVDDVRVVDTKGMTVPDVNDNNDVWHFSSKDVLKLGRMFGQALMEENGYVTPEKFTVTFDSDGGTSVPSQTLSKWQSIEKPANPTKEGYNFVKWVVEGSEEEFNFKDYSITSNVTLKAVYEKIEGYDDYKSFIELTSSTLKVQEGQIVEPTAEEWNSLKTSFSALGDDFKETLKNTTASETGSELEQALYLYDLVIDTFGPSRYENFLNRPTTYVPPTPDTSEPTSSEPEIPASSESSAPTNSEQPASSTSETASSSQTSADQDSGNSNLGVIIGASAGGVIAIAGIIAAIICIKNKKK